MSSEMPQSTSAAVCHAAAAPSILPAGVVRDNCMNNTATVGEQLRLHRINRQVGGQAPLLLPARPPAA